MTAVDDAPVLLGSLSPSRGSDFKSCPLRYRFRVLDRMPEPPSPAATRGTLVHSVLEHLFDVPAPERTPERALAMVEPSWQAALEAEPELATLFTDDADGSALATWLESARDLVTAYFALEDPTGIEPADRELHVEHALGDVGVLLRGIIDRLDVEADGALVVSDYKTGRSPGPGFEEQAFFGLKFYALLLWRSRGLVPRELRLIYLGDGVVFRYTPEESQLRGFERAVTALWQAIRKATESGDWRSRPSRLCDWCDFHAICPEFGGTPPPLPEAPLRLLLRGPEPVAVCEAEG